MELAAEVGPAEPGRLIMAAISAVFTIGYVASLLGECTRSRDEDWLVELSIGMEPEDGSLWVYGVGDDGVPAFTPRWHRQPARDHRRSKSLRKTTAT